MKKLLFALLLIFGVTVFAEGIETKNYTVHIGTGIGFISDYSSKDSIDGDAGNFEFKIEGLKEITPELSVGLGIAYQNMPKGDTTLLGKKVAKYEEYESIPLYVTAKYTFKNVEIQEGTGAVPYVKADLGYALNRNVEYSIEGLGSSKIGVDNGLYAGVGFGIEQNNINVGVMMQYTGAEVKGKSFDNYRVMLTAGYDFDISF